MVKARDVSDATNDSEPRTWLGNSIPDIGCDTYAGHIRQYADIKIAKIEKVIILSFVDIYGEYDKPCQRRAVSELRFQQFSVLYKH